MQSREVVADDTLTKLVLKMVSFPLWSDEVGLLLDLNKFFFSGFYILSSCAAGSYSLLIVKSIVVGLSVRFVLSLLLHDNCLDRFCRWRGRLFFTLLPEQCVYACVCICACLHICLKMTPWMYARVDAHPAVPS